MFGRGAKVFGGGARRWLAAPPSLLLFTHAALAQAAAPGQPFRLEYWAQGHCPEAAEFARQIQTRAPRLRPAEGDEPALGFYAELVERPGVATGKLTARTPDGREVVREVRGQTCDDVVTALALIAALAADPSQPIVATPKERRPAIAASTVPVDPAEPPAREAADPIDRWSYGAGSGLGFDSEIAPSPNYGLDVTFEAEQPGGQVARWLLLVGAHRASSAGTETQGGNAAFTWLSLRAAACPFRWPEQTPLFLRACGFLDAGVLQGSVALAADSRTRTHSWFAGGGFGRIEAMVGEVAFELDGGAAFPFSRDDYRANDRAPTAFIPPTAGILGRLGLSYRFQ